MGLPWRATYPGISCGLKKVGTAGKVTVQCTVPLAVSNYQRRNGFSFVLNTGLSFFAHSDFMMTSIKESWQDVAAAKRAATLASIPAEWQIPAHLMPADDVLDVTTFPQTSGLFTKEELEITAAGASEIVRQISNKKWTAEKVALAFCKAASVAHQLVCIAPRYLDLKMTINSLVDR